MNLCKAQSGTFYLNCQVVIAFTELDGMAPLLSHWFHSEERNTYFSILCRFGVHLNAPDTPPIVKYLMYHAPVARLQSFEWRTMTSSN